MTGHGSASDRAAASRAVLALWHAQGKWADVALEGVSMDPIIRDGAMLRVRFGKLGAADLRVGDVIIYSAPARLVAHRVIRIGRGRRAGMARVKGDPLTSWKATWIRTDEILGRVMAVTQPDGSRRYLNTPAGRMLSRTAAWLSMTVGAVDARLRRRRPVPPARSLTGRALKLLVTVHDAVHRYLETDRGRLLAPEERFLVAACRPSLSDQDVERIRSVAAQVGDWEQVREQAVSLGLAPLLGQSLSDVRLRAAAPEAFVAQITRAGLASAYLSMHQNLELARILDALSARGLDPILLKGAALNCTVYRNPKTRTMKDIDLLLPNDEIPAAEAVLEGFSYRPLYRPAHADPRRRAAFYGMHHHATPMISRKGRAIVELHRHIVTMGESARYDIDRIRARSLKVTLDGRTVRVPAPADLVLHTCLHLSYADRFVGKLRDLVDLHETVTRLGDRIDWNTMLEEVPSDAAARCLYSCLDLARRLYGTPVPADFLYELRRNARLGFFGARILRVLACSVLFNSADTRTTILSNASAKWCCDTWRRGEAQSTIRMSSRRGWAAIASAVPTGFRSIRFSTPSTVNVTYGERG